MTWNSTIECFQPLGLRNDPDVQAILKSIDNLGCLDVEVNDEDRQRADELSHPGERL
jgi:hypothetical protein